MQVCARQEEGDGKRGEDHEGREAPPAAALVALFHPCSMIQAHAVAGLASKCATPAQMVEHLSCACQVPGWKVGESVYINKRWVPPAQPVGAWGE